MPTISDVAAAAGVSMTSVSRVLNNKAHVRPALRERVLKAVSSLSYRPDIAARQLAGTKSFVLTLLIPEYNASYYATLVVAAAAECRKQNYHLLSGTIEPGEPVKEALERATAGVRPDGIILPPPLGDDPELVSTIACGNSTGAAIEPVGWVWQSDQCPRIRSVHGPYAAPVAARTSSDRLHRATRRA